MNWNTAIITISDRAHSGEYQDLSGPALKKACQDYGWSVTTEKVVPDDKETISNTILDVIQAGHHLVLTTGGTGIAARDTTPEAIREIMQVELPGFGEAMRLTSFAKIPNAILSRSLAAVVNHALVIALPGKPNGATECLSIVKDAIPHAVKLAANSPTSC